MRIGLAIPQYGFSLPSGQIHAADTVAWAQRAEVLGFDSAWVSDHFVYSFERYGADPAPIAAVEPMTALAAIAATTERVRMGVLVLCAPFRHPAILAKAASVIDQLSKGRLDLGLGAGWLQTEFDRFGYSFGSVGERFAALEDALAIVSGLTRSAEPFSYEGRSWSVHDITPSPPPTQRPIPTWVGGKGGPRLLRLAARDGIGWNVVWRVRPDGYAAKQPDIERACEAEGRDPATFRRSIGLYGVIGDTEADARATFERARAEFPGNAMRDETWETWRADTLSGSPEQIRERVAAFEALGIDELVVSPWTLPFTVMDDRHVEQFADALLRTPA